MKQVDKISFDEDADNIDRYFMYFAFAARAGR